MVTLINYPPQATRESLGLATDDSPEFAGIIIEGDLFTGPAPPPTLPDLGLIYQVGTFTPVPKMGSTPIPTSEVAEGQYTRLGDMVYINFSVPFNRGSNEGLFIIDGLPFQSTRKAFGSCLFTGNVDATGVVPAIWQDESRIFIYIQPSSTSESMSNFDHSKIAASTDITIHGNMSYHIE